MQRRASSRYGATIARVGHTSIHFAHVPQCFTAALSTGSRRRGNLREDYWCQRPHQAGEKTRFAHRAHDLPTMIWHMQANSHASGESWCSQASRHDTRSCLSECPLRANATHPAEDGASARCNPPRNGLWLVAIRRAFSDVQDRDARNAETRHVLDFQSVSRRRRRSRRAKSPSVASRAP